ncbi:MAG: hypothetical protein AMXMBFR64_17240 [Myxococcales bacterium]
MRGSGDERVLFDGRPSPLLLVGKVVRCTLWGGGALFLHFNHTDRWLAQALAALPEAAPEEVSRALWWAVHGLLLFIAFLAAWSLVIGSLRLLTTRYRITTLRIQEERGILSRSKDNLELVRVTDVQLDKPLILRLFGHGNLLVTSADRTTPYKLLYGLPDAEHLMETITEAVRPTVLHEIR